ncbi:MAG TPA: hypothetical protein VE757_09620 [Gaiellaceae bacterium]|nr:hypothetical protein [Gaiellaceae bacterium]
MTRAYKFLTADGRGVFSGFMWPLPQGGPGEWVEADVAGCRSGVHACRPADLPYWLAPALYEVELEEPLETLSVKVVAPRGRLIRRIDRWNETTREAYSRMCFARARELIDTAPDLADWEPPPSIELSEAARIGFIAARIAEQLGGVEAYLDERRRQTEWLVEQLALD